MSSYFLQVADSIVTELNAAPAGTFTRELGSVQGIFDPHRDLPEIADLRVDVVIGDRKSQPLSRVSKRNLLRVDIAFRQHISGEPESKAETEQLEGLVAVAEEVEAFFTNPPRRLQFADFAVWHETELIYPYLPSHLGGKRQFTSLLRLTYLVATK
jgi:hypothetical protein